MEIERKFLLKRIPDNLDQYKHHEIIQAYILNYDPVIRIRKWDDEYILTYKSKGMMSRIEEELPLNEDAFDKLLKKTEGITISKTRYIIPDSKGNTIELDCFHNELEGVYLAEVEFEDEASANAYTPEDWFYKDVTFDGSFHNSRISTASPEELNNILLISKEGFK